MDALTRHLLTQARDNIDAVLNADAPPTDCPHPPADRVDMSVMGDLGAFRCRACGHEFHPGLIPIEERV